MVEDDFFISLDMKMELQAAQAIVLGPVGRVQTGLDLIAREPEICAAIRDVNIGGEVVFPVADALLQRHVPFFFATGESRGTIPARFAHVEIFPKPSSSPDLIRGVARLLGTWTIPADQASRGRHPEQVKVAAWQNVQ